jgi:uncharacterized protein (DUF1778 family)
METEQTRLDLRTTEEWKALVKQAATLTGANMADFVRTVVYREAHRIILSHRQTELNAHESARFAELMASPPPPTAELQALFSATHLPVTHD